MIARAVMMKTKSLLPLLIFLAISLVPSLHAGAWGHESFENDSALDWVENFFKPDGVVAVERAISHVTTRKGYLDVDAASAAVAAAETLAIARGHPGRNIPPDVEAQAKRMPAKRVTSLLPPARLALDRVLADSELKELWADSPDYAAWRKAVEDLKARLR